MTRTKLSLITLLAAATAVPAIASADDNTRRGGNTRWTTLGTVGTHSHDAEDYIPVRTNQRFERIALTSEGRPVRLEGLDIQFADGRKYHVEVRETLRPGQRVMIDVPSYSPIQMLVLDYGNRGPHYRAREDARVEVMGLSSSYRDRSYRTDRYDRRDRGNRRFYQRPQVQQPEDNRFQWRGGVYVRIRG